MKTIRLLSLKLNNFQGGTFALDANGKDVSVYAVNGAGKTRLASAFQWLLFDKDSLGRADFEIKNLDAQGEAEHGLEHSVEGFFECEGNTPETLPYTLILKKVYKELWVKKRGSAERTFSGHTTDYFIDGVPCKEKEYQERVSEIAGDESIFRLLTSPAAFPSLHWKRQRDLLMEVCGDISDEDIFTAGESLCALEEILSNRSIDDHRKIINAKRTEINKELEKIPVRIDEVRRGLPDIAGIERHAVEKELKAADESIQEKKLQLQGIETGGRIAELSKKLQGIKADIQSMESDHYNETMKEVNKLNQEISEIEAKIAQMQQRHKDIDKFIPINGRKAAEIENELVKLREKWIAEDEKEFKDTTQTICPACDQRLPADRIEIARKKARDNYNSIKANNLKCITLTGEELTEKKEKYINGNEELRNEQYELTSLMAGLEDELKPLIVDRDFKRQMADDYSVLDVRTELLEEKKRIEAEIQSERDGKTTDMQAVQDQITDLKQAYSILKTAVDKLDNFDRGSERIEELMAQEKDLAAEFERLEGELYLTEQFIRTKVNLLTEEINSRFEIARFKLFDQLISGGLEECCQITVDGVPFDKGLNHSAQINAGLDVCRTLSKHYGIYAPIFVDNAEAVNNLIDMDTQVIRLVVSEDETLRVEVTNGRENSTTTGKETTAERVSTL